MAVKLRLRRMGRTHRPIYAVIAADSRSPRDGRFIEDLGRYRPVKEPAEVSLNEERIMYWLQNGAEISDTVRSLLSKQGIMLRLHLLRKGKSEEEIEQALNEWRAKQPQQQGKTTAADRRREALEAERKQADAEAAEREAARKKAEEEARRAAEEAKRAEAEARAQAQAVAAQAEAETQAKNAAAEAPATETPAAEAAPETEATTEGTSEAEAPKAE